MDDSELAKLTVKELRALNERIELAIRAAIRAKQADKRATGVAHPAVAAAPTVIDLERERDAWLASRR